jgi:hypothetical protein
LESQLLTQSLSLADNRFSGIEISELSDLVSVIFAYNLAQKVAKPDYEVDAKKAKVRLGQWVRLHDYNIAQKVKVIIEHFRQTVMGLLNGHAKAMVVTGSRKEAVRYKLEFDKYIKKNQYSQLVAIAAPILCGRAVDPSNNPFHLRTTIHRYGSINQLFHCEHLAG